MKCNTTVLVLAAVVQRYLLRDIILGLSPMNKPKSLGFGTAANGKYMQMVASLQVHNDEAKMIIFSRAN